MKKLVYSILSIITIGIIMLSCEKEKKSEIITATEASEIEEIQQKRPVIYHAEWEEWGRASLDCAGWGLCNFTDCWLCDTDSTLETTSGVVTYDDETGDGYLTIELNPAFPLENNAILNATPFTIDADIHSGTSIMHQGIYLFDPTVGGHGGYYVTMTVL